MFISRIVPEITVYDKVRTHVSACKTRDRGFPRFSATPISFANVRFWYTRTDELALPERACCLLAGSGLPQNHKRTFLVHPRTGHSKMCVSGVPETDISGTILELMYSRNVVY